MATRSMPRFAINGDPGPHPPSRVFVIDPQPLTRQGLLATLASEPDIVVAGHADNVQTVLHETASVEPDLFLIDIVLPTGGGVEAVRALKQRYPRSHILVVTTQADVDLFQRAVEAGAVGYVLKDIPSAHLISAVRAIRNGATMINPYLTRQLVEHLGIGRSARTGTHARRFNGLTAREMHILAEVARGLTDKEIASCHHLAECTVKHYLRAVYERFQLRNRAHAAAFAVRRGLVGDAL